MPAAPEPPPARAQWPRPPSRSAEPAENLASVVEHHEQEERTNRDEPDPEDVFPRPQAERTPLERFDDVYEDLPAVEDRNRQQVQDRDVDAQEGDQAPERLETVPRGGDRDLRDAHGPRETAERRLPRREVVHFFEDQSAGAEREMPRVRECLRHWHRVPVAVHARRGADLPDDLDRTRGQIR